MSRARMLMDIMNAIMARSQGDPAALLRGRMIWILLITPHTTRSQSVLRCSDSCSIYT
jgi:hypothetical protein